MPVVGREINGRWKRREINLDDNLLVPHLVDHEDFLGAQSEKGRRRPASEATRRTRPPNSTSGSGIDCSLSINGQLTADNWLNSNVL
jgi:hypothetical protein